MKFGEYNEEELCCKNVNIVFNQRDAQLYQKYYGEMPDAIIPISTPTPEIDWEKAALQTSARSWTASV